MVVKKDKPTNVLLVDNERQEYLLIGYLLSEAHYTNYRLIWCQNLEEGLGYIEQNRCDVVLLDYHWGATDKDFLRRAHALNSRVPIIVMTDGMEEEVDHKAIREGASDYLIKERVNSEILERTIRYSIERKQIEHHLDHLAHYDHLTDLPNRTLFLDRLNQAINLSQRSGSQFTLMYIDLNDFKEVNDNYGHDIGDGLLKEFARRLQQCVRRSDTVARIGGDEFTILLNNVGATPKIMSVAQKLIEQTSELFEIDNHELSIGCSVGIAVFPDAGSDAESLQRHADMAMYQAKQEAASSYRFFSNMKKSNLRFEHLTPNDLKQLVTERKIEISYTPRIDLKTNKVAAIEVNPIWHHDRWGDQYYEDFASSIDSSETLRLLTEWMLAQGLIHRTKLAALQKIPLAFVVDGQQLQSSRFCYTAKKIMSKYRIDPASIEFSMLYRKERRESESIEACVENIHEIGSRFSLHRFGENSFSLASMQNYNISTLHLDQTLLTTAISNKEDAKLVEVLVGLANKLNKVVVADGVATKGHRELLRAMGCHQVKGKVVGENYLLPQLKAFLDKTEATTNVE